MKRHVDSEEISGGNPDSILSPMDYFLEIFPHTQLTAMTKLTNCVPEKRGKKPLTVGEMLKFFEVLNLMTRLELSTRASLWTTTSTKIIRALLPLGRPV